MSTTLVSSLIGALVCGILGFVVLAVIVGLVVSSRRRSRLQANLRAAQGPTTPAAAPVAPTIPPQQRDIDIPLRRFGQCAVFIITGDQDYGYFPAYAPQKMLQSSWGIMDGAAARREIESLLGNVSGPDLLAFDAVRAIHLARACAGATFIPAEESWAFVARAARMLQAAFQTWDQVGEAYLAAKNTWLRARDLDTNDGTEANVARLRREVWPTFPLQTRL